MGGSGYESMSTTTGSRAYLTIRTTPFVLALATSYSKRTPVGSRAVDEGLKSCAGGGFPEIEMQRGESGIWVVGQTDSHARGSSCDKRGFG